MTTATAPNTQTKSVGLAYFLLILFGGFGVHRMYLGRPASGILMAIITISGFFVGFTFILTALWLLVDLFLVPGMARSG